ncbi:MAG TPA: CDP-alcohol phosphatidyltransferase family protein [Myxococcota bacterium]|nr:CDP-alcohol phosphatidyltransferase family protein [Myxococcota bacterium]
MGFLERYEGLRPGLAVGRNTNNLDFWGITFGRPTAFGLLLLIGDISWLTPNILTHMSNICLVAGAVILMKATWPAYILAAILLNVSLTFDCADGQLARYRKNGSLLGSYYDKVSDYFGMILLYSTLSWTVFTQTGHAWYFILALSALGCNMMTGYTKWLVTAHNKMPPAKVDERDPGRARTALRVALKIFEFNELDLFLWIGLGLLMNKPEIGLIVMGVTQPIAALGTVIKRGYFMSR